MSKLYKYMIGMMNPMITNNLSFKVVNNYIITTRINSSKLTS